jgi:hypothetical protein
LNLTGIGDIFESMRIQFLVTLIVLAMLLRPCQAQIPAQDIRAMAGPWECIDARGIHGISISAVTALVQSGGSKKISSQTINVYAYERKEGVTVGSFTSVNGNPSKGAILDETHLVIHQVDRNVVLPARVLVLPGGVTVSVPSPPLNVIPAYDLDVQFDSVKQQWAGSWSLCNKTGENVLERPHPGQGVTASILVGDWVGIRNPKTSLLGIIPEGLGTLHVRQGADGNLISWFDEFDDQENYGSGTIYQAAGEEINFSSVVSNAIAFAINYNYCSSCFATGRFEGTLSIDGQTLTGIWYWSGSALGETAVPTVFRRIN